MKTKPEKIPEALIITFATAFAYLCAFFYEWGFLIYYRVPVSWIEIDLNRLLTIGALSFIGTMTGGAFLTVARRRWIDVVIALLLIGFVVFIVYAGLESWFYSIGIGAFMTFIFTRAIKNYKIRSFLRAYGLTFRQVLLVLCFPVILFVISLIWAFRKDTFLVRAGTKNTIVVKQYGDTFIEEKYNPSTLTLNDTIITTKRSDTSSTSLSAKHIGRLKSKSF